MRKHPALLCVSVCLLLIGISASRAFALPQYPGETPFESQESTTLTLVCSISIFDSSQPVSAVPFGQQGNAVALPVSQDSPLAAPEPSSLIFLVIGLGLFGVRTWLRTRNR